MRNVLFVTEPLGTGKAWRSLAIAEQLHALFPVVAPAFLCGPAAGTLLRAAGRFPVDDSLVAAVPQPADLVAAEADPASLARAAERAIHRHAASHAHAALRTAKALAAELVVVDSLFAAPPVLRRGGFDVAFLTDHFRDAPAERGFARAAATRMVRRAVVASSQLRFFLGEPSYLASPELRVWSRRWFRYSGPISGLARLSLRDCATLRDELGIGRKKLVVVATGSAFAAPLFEVALQGVGALAAARGDLVVRHFAGPELALDDGAAGPPAELLRWLAIADAAVVSGGLSLLAECAGLKLPTLALPLPGHPLQERHVDYHVQRFGVQRLPAGRAPSAAAIADAVRTLLEQPTATRPHDAPDGEEQRRNAAFIADLLADHLGRKRPAVPDAPSLEAVEGGRTPR
ncbi:MAG: hypothetical protein JNL90_21195 [Planctomycetes bacterium]|nr:hypothetical protein [Planctomycetota bacterium]